MSAKLSVGIALPANHKGGPQKLTALAALDLARRGHRVTIFIPFLPYYYYHVALGRRPASWLRACLPHLRDWLRHRRFSFQELLDEEGVRGRVSIRFVPRRASKRQLKRLDCLIIHSIAQVVEYRRSFPQERQVYLLHHPEEWAHGHADTFIELRNAFAGKILVISPFTARQVAGHVSNPPVIPNAIAPAAWSQRHAFDPGANRRDILFFWKDFKSAANGSEIVKALMQVRPGTTLTIWARGQGYKAAAQEQFPGVKIVQELNEKELVGLYLEHSLLMFPSTYEGFGMPPIEALACGCLPVLRPEVGAAEMYARDGENSVHINGDPTAIAQKMAGILDSPETLKAMRTAAPESVEPFNPDGYGQRLLEAAGIL